MILHLITIYSNYDNLMKTINTTYYFIYGYWVLHMYNVSTNAVEIDNNLQFKFNVNHKILNTFYYIPIKLITMYRNLVDYSETHLFSLLTTHINKKQYVKNDI